MTLTKVIEILKQQKKRLEPDPNQKAIVSDRHEKINRMEKIVRVRAKCDVGLFTCKKTNGNFVRIDNFMIPRRAYAIHYQKQPKEKAFSSFSLSLSLSLLFII